MYVYAHYFIKLCFRSHVPISILQRRCQMSEYWSMLKSNISVSYIHMNSICNMHPNNWAGHDPKVLELNQKNLRTKDVFDQTTVCSQLYIFCYESAHIRNQIYGITSRSNITYYSCYTYDLWFIASWTNMLDHSHSIDPLRLYVQIVIGVSSCIKSNVCSLTFSSDHITLVLCFHTRISRIAVVEWFKNVILYIMLNSSPENVHFPSRCLSHTTAHTYKHVGNFDARLACTYVLYGDV